MVIPTLCNWANLNALKDSSEVIFMRVVLPGKKVTSQIKMKHGRRTYVFDYSPTLRQHVLDIPLTVWAQGINGSVGNADVTAGRAPFLGVPAGAYRPASNATASTSSTSLNTSICGDINKMHKGQFVITAIPYASGTYVRP